MASFGEYNTDTTIPADKRNNCLALVLDARCLVGGAQRIADFEKERDADAATGCVTESMATVRVLYQLLYIAQHSHLGMDPTSAAPALDVKPGKFKEVPLSRPELSCYHGDTAHLAVYVAAVRSLANREDILAYVFVFYKQVTDFCFDKALEKLFTKLSPEVKRANAVATENSTVVELFRTRSDWVKYGLSQYVDYAFTRTDKGDKAVGLKLSSVDNPARTLSVFTFARADELIRKIQGDASAGIPTGIPAGTSGQVDMQDVGTSEQVGTQEQTDMHDVVSTSDQASTEDVPTDIPSFVEMSDVVPDEPVTTTTTAPSYFTSTDDYLVFPDGAFFIRPQLVDPEIVFRANCHNWVPPNGDSVEKRRQERWLEMLSGEVGQTDSVDSAIHYFNMLRESCLSEVGKDPAYLEWGKATKEKHVDLFLARMAKEKTVEGLRTREEYLLDDQFTDAEYEKEMTAERKRLANVLYYKEILKQRSIQTLQSVLMSDTRCPATAVTHGWLRRQQSRNPKWSAIHLIKKHLDSTLTDFGNFVTRETFMLECVETVNALHNEQLLLLISMLGSSDIREGLRLHFSMHGPPSSGKSFLLELLEKLTIPGMIKVVATQSEKSLTGDSIFNGLAIIMDEANSKMTGQGDGSGSADMKEVLSRGVTYSEMIVVDKETKKRVLVTTKSERICPHYMGTNLGIWRFQPAIVSRLATLVIPDRQYPDRNTTVMKYAAMSSDTGKERHEQYADEWRTRYAIANMLYVAIRIGMIPDINTTIPEKMLPVVLTHLREQGFSAPNRDQDRIILDCKLVCIYYAITKVFFTNDHYEEGTPFEYKQIFTCMQYMYVTREQFWFALSHLFPTFINPFTDYVLHAIYELVSENSGNIYTQTWHPEKGATVDDQNYYWLNLSDSVVNNDSILTGACAKIVRKIRQTSDIGLSEDNVRDVLEFLKNQKKVAKSYDMNGNLTSKERQYDVIRIKNLAMKKGLEISSHFLDSRLQTNYKGLLETTIRQTMRTNKDDPVKRVVVAYPIQRDPEMQAIPEPFADVKRAIAKKKAEDEAAKIRAASGAPLPSPPPAQAQANGNVPPPLQTAAPLQAQADGAPAQANGNVPPAQGGPPALAPAVPPQQHQHVDKTTKRPFLYHCMTNTNPGAEEGLKVRNDAYMQFGQDEVVNGRTLPKDYKPAPETVTTKPYDLENAVREKWLHRIGVEVVEKAAAAPKTRPALTSGQYPHDFMWKDPPPADEIPPQSNQGNADGNAESSKTGADGLNGVPQAGVVDEFVEITTDA
jgi:hypothetical protein